VIRIVIADDQALVRGGFRMILAAEAGFEVVGEAADGREAVSLCRSLTPDVVLMDIRMPELDGLAATRQVMHASPATRVLMLTTFGEDGYVWQAMNAGASGFLLKDVPPEQLVSAVRTIHRGDALLAPAITRRLIEQFAAGPEPGAVPPQAEALTGREREVLRLVAQGLTNAEIAQTLILGETTVKTHVARLLAKLGLRDRVQAVVFAYETGLVRPAGGRRP
jgi:DNA-binding NarL/FixJ family response regulator